MTCGSEFLKDTDLGSQSEGAGTCNRYLSYRCATNLMYIMHDILGSYITNDHQLSQLPSCHCCKITKIFEKLEHFKKQTDHLWFKRNRSLGIQMFDQPMTHFFWVKRWLIDFLSFQPFNRLVIYQFYST